MKVTMVKKRLLSGEECRQCAEATQYLVDKDVFDKIDVIVWFDESTSDDEGHLLAAEHSAQRAPFYIVERPGRPAEIVDSTVRIARML